jgi:hypothetical protein
MAIGAHEKGKIMNCRKIVFFLLLSITLFTGSILAQTRHREAVLTRFLGAITGATLAEEAFGSQCYYHDGPAYLFVYPGAPMYAYDYPTYAYSPLYAYQDMRRAIYPSYFFSR